MLRGLILMNPLVIDKISKRFYFYKDSGFIYTKQLLKSFPKDYRFSWLVPDQVIKNKNKECDWFLEAHPNIELLPYPYPTSIHRNRYDFYGKNILDLFPYPTDIDFIINNQPELSGGLRTLFDTAKREKPIIFNFFHWIDCQESRKFGEDLGGYFYREMEGFISADYSCFHNDYAFSLFKNEFKNRFSEIGSDYSELKESKVLHFKPAATKFGKLPVNLSRFDGKKIVLFNHRLNQTTQWKEVVSIFDEIHNTRKDFVLWMTDAANKESARLVKDYPFVHVEQLPFENYGYLMEKSHFSVCNHKGYSTWNMAAIDAIFNNCFTLIPKREVYIDMFGEYEYSSVFMHENKKELKEKCIALLDKPKIETDSIIKSPKLKHLFEPNDEIFNEKILESIEKRCENKTAKYDLALDLIMKNKTISKKDLINSLWSFHCNSNFQKMRWRFLTMENVADDTTQNNTIYKKKQ
jgi:hypothetical protein